MLYGHERRCGLDPKLNVGDEIVCVHTVKGIQMDAAQREFIQPDVRSRKPKAVYIRDENQTAFFQKLILTAMDGKRFRIAAPNEIALSLKTSLRSKAAANALRDTIKAAANRATNLFEKEDICVVEDLRRRLLFMLQALIVRPQKGFCPDEPYGGDGSYRIAPTP